MKNGADGDKALSPCRQMIFAFTVLAILLLTIYGNSFNCSWHFDDVANITNNTAVHLKNLSWNETKRLLLEGHLGAHASPRPLAYLSFGVNYFFGGLEVTGYHLVNLSVHFVASIFLFLLSAMPPDSIFRTKQRIPGFIMWHCCLRSYGRFIPYKPRR